RLAMTTTIDLHALSPLICIRAGARSRALVAHASYEQGGRVCRSLLGNYSIGFNSVELVPAFACSGGYRPKGRVFPAPIAELITRNRNRPSIRDSREQKGDKQVGNA